VIVDAILGLLVGLLRGLLALLPSVPWPDWLVGDGTGTLRGSVTALAGSLSGFGAWLPLDVFVVVLQGAAGVVAAALVVRVVRFVLSVVTLGGGQ
jgi:hypothetical protein